MSPEMWRLVDEIYDDVMERPVGERERFLNDACAGVPAQVRDKVVELLHLPEDIEPMVEQFEPNLLALKKGAAEPPLTWIDGVQESLPDFGQLERIRYLGHGGMGVVYKAFDRGLGIDVALKTVLPHCLSNPKVIRIFHTEPRSMARLKHPHIVHVYHVDEHEGRPYFTMNLINGVSLDCRLEEFCQAPRRAAELLVKVARAIHHAHVRGVLHRDLKPANIILDKEGEPHVTDFGLAKQASTGERLVEMPALMDTVSRVFKGIAGSIQYMSPEQATPGKDVTIVSDVYGLGATLYTLLSGRPPFRGETVEDTLKLVRDGKPEPPGEIRRGLPRDLEAICLKCLAKDPRQRYADAAALAEDLSAFLDGRPIEARPVGPLGHALKWAKRRPAVAALTGTLVGIILAALAVVGWQWQTAVTAQQAAVTARQDAERLLVRLALRQAENDGEKGEVGRALLWLARALGSIPREDKARRQLVRANVGAWSARLHPLRGLLSHPDALQGVALSADGGTALTVAVDGTVRRWDTATGEPLGEPWKAEGPVRAVAFSPDVRTLVTAGEDGTVRLWEAATGKLLGQAPPEDTDSARAVAFAPDGKTVVTGGLKGAVYLWNATSLGRTGQLLLPNDGAIRALCLARYSEWLLTVSRGGEEGEDTAVRLWKVADGKATAPRPLPHRFAVRAVAFSPNGASILTAGEDFTARLWTTADGELRQVFPHQDVVQAVAFSSDGKTVLTGSHDLTARLWDADTGEQIGSPLQHPGPVCAVAFDRGGQAILTGCRDHTARLWAVATASSCLRRFQHDSQVMAVVVSPDGTALVTATDGGKVYWWNLANGECRVLGPQHERDVWALAITADGALLVTGSPDKTVRLWDVKGGREKNKLSHNFCVRSVALDRDGKILLTGSGDMVADGDRTEGEARLYEGAPPNSLRLRLPQPGGVWAVALSPDGKTCAIAAGDNGAQLYDTVTGKALGKPLRHLNRVVSVAFSPDGRFVATGSTDETAQLWDPATGEPVGQPLRHPEGVWAVAFSPNGETLVTGCHDGSARLWDTSTGMSVGPSWRHQKVVWAVACSPDGHTVATGSGDRTARLWQIPRPVPDEPERIILWTRVITGMALDDDGVVQWLDAAAWQQCRRRLEELGGPPVP
jgi:eukaryotic-like serine/threonine-protein kinase